MRFKFDTKAVKKLREIAIEEGAFLQSDSPIYRLASGKMSTHKSTPSVKSIIPQAIDITFYTMLA